MLDAVEHARAQRIGAFTVDGKMIDIPFIRRAEAIVAAAGKLGLGKHE